MNQPQKQFKVLVIGDACWDISSYGRMIPNIEDPRVATIKLEQEFARTPGMAFNVLNLLKGFGIDTTILARNSDVWSIKHRVYSTDMFGGTAKYLTRIDEDKQAEPIKIDYLSTILEANAVVVCDYLKGAVSKELLEYLDYRCGQENIPLFIDTKKTDLAYLKHAIIKVNRLEASKISTWPLDAKLIVTLGSEGCTYAGNIYETALVNAVDVCGAGDAFLAGLVYGYLSKGSLEEACKMANKVASMYVTELGFVNITRNRL